MRFTLICLALFGFSAFASAQGTRCLSGDCTDGSGYGILSNGDRYEGTWVGNLMDGQGEYTYTSGATYTGDFRRGKMHGEGVMRYPDGTYYTGDWRDNKKHGTGRLVKISGETIAGTWANGSKVAAPAKPTESDPFGERDLKDCNTDFCASGEGRYTYRDGAVYEGEFVDGEPIGRGKVRYANGDRYAGGWKGNAPHGKGSYSFHSGKKVAGNWEDGRLISRAYENSNVVLASNTDVREKAADGEPTMYAVIVGIGAYSAMQTLNYTDDDAYQMYAFLKSPEGGALPDEQLEVLVDERATRANIERALTEKLDQADADDVVVFYFSGHGVDGYFVPVDYDGVHNLLSHERVEQLLEGSAAKHKLVLADACHSGGLLAARAASTSATRLYAAFTESRGGTALLLSSRSEEVSLEANGLRSGVFSHFVMRGMRGEADRDANRVVTVDELFDYTYERVRSYTGGRQTPVLTGEFDSSMPVAVLR